MKTNAEFLRWIALRLVVHYGENKHADFVRQVEELADKFDKLDNVVGHIESFDVDEDYPEDITNEVLEIILPQLKEIQK